MSRIRRLSIQPSEAELSRYRALVFDCYGTLIDWERGMYDNLQPLFTQKTCPEPSKVFEAIGSAETSLQGANKTMPYPMVLSQAYFRVCGALRLHFDEDDALAFGRSVGSWPAFPDSSDALARLKALGLKVVILSNVNNESFAQTRQKLETDWEFDAVCTAEDIGSYKPDLRNFRYVLDLLDQRFDIEPREVLSVAQSKYHDVEPAHTMGLKAVWINREAAFMGAPKDESIQPDWEFADMRSFARAMERANGAA